MGITRHKLYYLKGKTMTLAEKLKDVPPLELELMILKAVQGSAYIEGMEKSAQEIGKLIDEKTKQLETEKTSN